MLATPCQAPVLQLATPVELWPDLFPMKVLTRAQHVHRALACQCPPLAAASQTLLVAAEAPSSCAACEHHCLLILQPLLPALPYTSNQCVAQIVKCALGTCRRQAWDEDTVKVWFSAAHSPSQEVSQPNMMQCRTRLAWATSTARSMVRIRPHLSHPLPCVPVHRAALAIDACWGLQQQLAPACQLDCMSAHWGSTDRLTGHAQ